MCYSLFCIQRGLAAGESGVAVGDSLMNHDRTVWLCARRRRAVVGGLSPRGDGVSPSPTHWARCRKQKQNPRTAAALRNRRRGKTTKTRRSASTGPRAA